MTKRLNRELDSVYFRILRNGKWKPVCFSDLTNEEMDQQLQERTNEWLIDLSKILGKALRQLGDEFNLMGEG